MKKILGLALLAAMTLAVAPAKAQFYGGFGGYGGFQSSNNAYMQYLAFLRYKKALEDGENMKNYWKGDSYLGITYGAPMNYRVELEDFSRSSRSREGATDSVFRGSAVGKVGFYAEGMSDHMLFMLSETSIISLSIGTNFSYSRWQGSDNYYLNGPKSTAPMFEMFGVGIPVTLDYKSGCDVNFRPETKTCWAVGAGVVPSYYSYGMNSFAASSAFTVQPYAYASFGFYMGVCAKVKLGVIPYFDELHTTNGSGPGTPHVYTEGARPVFFLGIGMMTHSQDWNKGSAERKPWFGGNSGGSRRGSRGGRGINGRMF